MGNIIWTCDVDDATPRFADAFEYDECNVFIEMKWSGACFAPPPPNEECEFRSGLFGGPHLNLSTVKGNKYQLTQLNITKAYENGPCQFRIDIDSRLACK